MCHLDSDLLSCTCFDMLLYNKFIKKLSRIILEVPKLPTSGT